MGILVFSTLCSTISSSVLHAPFTVPEVLIIPFLILRRKKFRSLTLNIKLFLKFLWITFFLVLIALLYGIFDFSSIVSCARCYIYIFLGICLFDSKNLFTDDDLMYLSLGSIIGWAIGAYSNLKYLMVERSDAFISYGLFLAIPIFICLTLSRKKYLLFGIGLAFLIVVFMFAGIRRVIAVFIMSLVFYILVNFTKSPKKIFPLLLLTIILIVFFYLILPLMESTVMDLSPYLYYRIFARSQGALSSNADSSDLTRLSNLTLLSSTNENLFLPHGFNTIRYDKVVGSGVFNDVPVFSIAWIIGLPLTVILLLYYVKIALKAFCVYLSAEEPMVLSMIVSLLCMFCLLYLDGTFMTYVYAAPITGLCLGKLKYYTSKKYRI